MRAGDLQIHSIAGDRLECRRLIELDTSRASWPGAGADWPCESLQAGPMPRRPWHRRLPARPSRPPRRRRGCAGRDSTRPSQSGCWPSAAGTTRRSGSAHRRAETPRDRLQPAARVPRAVAFRTSPVLRRARCVYGMLKVRSAPSSPSVTPGAGAAPKPGWLTSIVAHARGDRRCGRTDLRASEAKSPPGPV